MVIETGVPPTRSPRGIFKRGGARRDSELELSASEMERETGFDVPSTNARVDSSTGSNQLMR